MGKPIKVSNTRFLNIYTCILEYIIYPRGERGGSVVECRTPEREVRGSRPTAAVLCPWARHFTPRKYWLITQEAIAPSRHDWKIVDWDVKPQHNQPYILEYIMCLILFHVIYFWIALRDARFMFFYLQISDTFVDQGMASSETIKVNQGMASSETIKKHLICSLCLDVFKDPKTLPCLHTICESCLQGHIDTVDRTTVEKTNIFKCPVCRADTVHEDGNASRNDWAHSFNTNQVILTMLKTQPPEEMNETEEPHCIPCSLDNKLSSAYSMCITCGEYLCERCHNDHSEFKITRNHVVIKVSEYPKDASTIQELSRLEICRIHCDKKIQFKCSSHDSCICCICAITEHRNCDDIVPIETVHQQATDVHAFDNYLQAMESLKNKTEHALAVMLNDAEKFDSTFSRVEKQTQEFILGIKSALNHIEDEFIQPFSQYMELEKRKNGLCIVECVGLIDYINKSAELATAVQRNGSNAQQLILSKEFDNNIEKINACMKVLDSTNFDDMIKFVNNETKVLWSMLQGITNIGLELLSTLKHVPQNQTRKRSTQRADITKDKNKNSSSSSAKTGVTVLNNSSNSSLSAAGSKTSLAELDDEREIKTSKSTMQFDAEQDTENTVSETQTLNSAHKENEISVIIDAIIDGSVKPDKDDPTSEENMLIQDTKSSTKNSKLGNGQTNDSLAKWKFTDTQNTRTDNTLQKLVSSKSDFEQSFMHCAIEKCSEYNISISKPSAIISSHNGTLCLKSGEMIFLDKSNKVIKLITSGFQLKRYKAIKEIPLDVVVVEADKIGVATCTPKTIEIFQIQYADIVHKQTFPIRDIVCSLCTVDGDFAILEKDLYSTVPETYVQIRSKQNQIVKEIDTLKDSTGKKTKIQQPNIIRSQRKKELVIYEPNHLTVFGKSGRMICTIDTSYLKNVDFIAFDIQNNIYLCDTDSGIIHLISWESYEVSRILLSGISKPATVTYNPVSESVVLGCLNDDKIHVYRFRRGVWQNEINK